MIDTARKIKDRLNVVQVDRDELNKLIDERNDWGYDALCMRFEQIVNELVYYKATSQEAKEKGHYGDIPYYKQYYGSHIVRFFQELDSFVGGLHDNCNGV